MRILLLTQIVPYPPDSGPKIKTYNVLRYLAQHHEVSLISFTRSTAELDAMQDLRQFCTHVVSVPLRRSRVRDVGYLVRSLTTGRPFLIERDDMAAMHTAVGDLTARWQPDAIHADQLSMGQFALRAPARLRVLDEHNAVWTIVRRAAEREPGPRRALAELEWRKLKRYEGELCRQFDRVTVVSLEDQQALERAAASRLNAVVIPIAIDTQELVFQPRTPQARDVLSVATMFYPPNVQGVQWFGEAVFPRIRRAVPETQFLVVGSRPPVHIQRMMSPASGIVVTGYVAELQPLLERSAVLVVPLHSGSGMRVKILEAFARGIPIVSTRIGVEGIDAQPGEHLLVGDTPAEFADAVIKLVQDRALAARLATAARKLVEERYDWRRALAALDVVYSPAVPVSQQVS